MNKESLGMHYKFILLGVAFDKLVDTKLVINLLSGLISAAGMRPLGPPHVYSIREELHKQGLDPDPEEPEGISGIQVLSTSHVAVDTWPHRGIVVSDIFSCNLFDVEKVVAVYRELLDPGDILARDLSFSLKYPIEDSEEASI